MNNVEFFNMFKKFIIEQCIEYKNENLWVYYEILKQYQDKDEIREMIYNCNDILNIRYDIPTVDNWGSDGIITIDVDAGFTYEITLCHYSTYSVQIKKINYNNMLLFNETKYNKLKEKWHNDIAEIDRLHKQNRTAEIDNIVKQLSDEKEKLERELKE